MSKERCVVCGDTYALQYLSVAPELHDYLPFHEAAPLCDRHACLARNGYFFIVEVRDASLVPRNTLFIEEDHCTGNALMVLREKLRRVLPYKYWMQLERPVLYADTVLMRALHPFATPISQEP